MVFMYLVCPSPWRRSLACILIMIAATSANEHPKKQPAQDDMMMSCIVHVHSCKFCP
ncbi:hypothetical protein HanRHA438_Chr09g0413191 [Helianthus annuus]|nr:hypothetical protein HanRHA438_Chr09g0413191 [Helianthus annuus]